jgi:hypothetical protein
MRNTSHVRGVAPFLTSHSTPKALKAREKGEKDSISPNMFRCRPRVPRMSITVSRWLAYF